MTEGRPRTRVPSWRALRQEAERDQEESPFTEALRRVWLASPGVIAAVFVDDEGECVDYCSGVDPYDAKVTGAHMRFVVDVVGRAVPLLGGGEMHALEVYGGDREIVARRVDGQYLLVVLAQATTFDVKVLDQVEAAVADLRSEASLEVPPWDPQSSPLEVELRGAVGWDYAPSAFLERGRRIRVADVLGRWAEPGGAAGGELSCFRVRTEGGVELTLVHDLSRDRWTRG
jgi:predicted regulator of Ras-like GTPase activity (Roadblock/LC7/MglB family)